MDWPGLIALGVTAFVATNIDDSLLLVLFFGDRRFRAWQVCAGQALGIGLLVAISLVIGLLALALPGRWVGLLGLLPIALGARELFQRRGKADENAQLAEVAVDPGANGWKRVAAVAGVTLANGGDNVGVYAPLFAGRAPRQMALILVVFAVMLAVWLIAAYWLARRSAVAERVQRVGRLVFPYALIGLGIIILVEAFLD